MGYLTIVTIGVVLDNDLRFSFNLYGSIIHLHTHARTHAHKYTKIRCRVFSATHCERPATRMTCTTTMPQLRSFFGIRVYVHSYDLHFAEACATTISRRHVLTAANVCWFIQFPTLVKCGHIVRKASRKIPINYQRLNNSRIN